MPENYSNVKIEGLDFNATVINYNGLENLGKK